MIQNILRKNISVLLLQGNPPPPSPPQKRIQIAVRVSPNPSGNCQEKSKLRRSEIYLRWTRYTQYGSGQTLICISLNFNRTILSTAISPLLYQSVGTFFSCLFLFPFSKRHGEKKTIALYRLKVILKAEIVLKLFTKTCHTTRGV